MRGPYIFFYFFVYFILKCAYCSSVRPLRRRPALPFKVTAQLKVRGSGRPHVFFIIYIFPEQGGENKKMTEAQLEKNKLKALRLSESALL